MNAHPAIQNGVDAANPAAETRLGCRIQKRFAGQQEFAVDVSFEAATGFTILFGASGAGKTTLLDCVAGLTRPDSGRISIGDRVVFDSSLGVNLPVAERHVGYVFQNLALFPHMTVEQNVAYGLNHLSSNERSQRTTTILEAFRIAQFSRRNVGDISGGERQRVALARTLVTDPQLLLLDEPLAALDSPTKSHIIDDLQQWNRTRGIPILYVTHSREEVFALGESVIVLEAGRILRKGTPHDVMSAPLQETVAQLAGFENIFDAAVEALSPDRGTMTCRLSGDGGSASIETPLVRGGVGTSFRIGIRAGDILLATALPQALSARNIIPGRIVSLDQRDVMISARVQCAVEMEVHLTLAARDSLQLEVGREVWLVIKTHSCHLMQRAT
ncbi:MAG: molybdenum ABC transporter ATP-binding protein [Acidobacteriota bacterium]